MNAELIYAKGFLNQESLKELACIRNEMEREGLRLEQRDMTGSIYNSALDFTDLDLIAISTQCIQSIISSGLYDVLKTWLVRLWNAMRGDSQSKVPFTIVVDGVPTINGPETIKVKIPDGLSNSEKKYVIDKTFDLAEKIAQNQVELLKLGKYYTWFNGHVFYYEPTEKRIQEIDVEAEVKKKMEE